MRRIELGMLAIAATSIAFACGGGDGASGDVECSGAACVCPSSGDCAVDCTSDCDLQCAGSGNCDFVCGDACVASCTGSGACIVDAGGGSTVACPGAGGCDVTCHGDCDVSCPGSGNCIVRCDPGATCNLTDCAGPVEDCGDGFFVCGVGCPP